MIDETVDGILNEVERLEQEAKPKRKRKPQSEETKAKISASKKGKPGHPVSEEQRRKASEASKKAMAEGKLHKIDNECRAKSFGRDETANTAIANRMAAVEAKTTSKELTVKDPGDGCSRKILGSIQYALNLSSTVNRNDPTTMMDALANMVSFCCENDVKVTNQLCYLACNVSTDDVAKWASGALRGDDPRYKEFAITVRRVCSTFREQLAADSKLNPVLTIWWQKVYEGYREDREVAQEASTDRKLTAAEIAEKYKDMPN